MDRVIATHAATEGLSREEIRALYAEGASMGTFVDPEDIADMVVFLSSARGKRISGQVISVDGHTETLYPRTHIQSGKKRTDGQTGDRP